MIIYFFIALKQYPMAACFLFVWCSLGDALYNKRKFVELVWKFYGKETEKNLEAYPYLFVLNIVEGKKYEVF